MFDTQGPAIRTGDVAQPIPLAAGERFVFTLRGDSVPGVKTTSVGYEDFVTDVSGIGCK
jgi:pyruvate kinase